MWVALFLSWLFFFSPFKFFYKIKTVFQWWLPRETRCLPSFVLLSVIFLCFEFYRQYLFFVFLDFFLLQIGDALIEIASNIMLVDDHVLWMAQKEDKACTRIVRCVEQITSQILTSKTQVISKVFQIITKRFVHFFSLEFYLQHQNIFFNITSGIKKVVFFDQFIYFDNRVFTTISF